MPTLRLQVLSTLAGALEPCGCVKDMLGGIDHAAAITENGRKAASASLLVAAGPSLFADPTLPTEARAQSLWKAETIADSLGGMGLSVWVPGANDWAAGAEELGRLRSRAGAALLAANLRGPGSAGVQPTRVVEAASLKVGFAGVSLPVVSGVAPTGVEVGDAERSLAEAERKLEAEGAQIRVAVAAVPRGDALRLAERVPGFQILVVGKPFDRGDANDGPVPATVVGDTLVVQAPNHLQGVAVVDLYVQPGDFRFRDGSGLAEAERRERLADRIAELERRVAQAEQPDSGVRSEDLAARRKDLQSLRAELEKLKIPAPPPEGSFFRYSLTRVSESAGADAAVTARLKGYYRRVNEHNREAFANRLPPPVAPEGRGYIGAEKCAVCHAEEKKFWLTTGHAKAYDVLVRDDKQFNLDCVSCHVTGYEKPGGSTVTHVKGLEHNQCENCHGPGSRHAESPTNPDFIVAKPPRSLCASACHHPPHVNADWNVDEAWKKIIGPGHGDQPARDR